MRRILVFGLLALALAACQQATGAAPTVEPGPTFTAFPEGALAIVMTPSAPDKTTVTGVLKVGVDNPQPAAGFILYLADIITEASGTPYLAGFERTNSPRTLTDPEGRFVFVDVVPEPYSLVLDRVFEAYLLGRPDQQPGDFIFEPQGGQVLDLGTLVYPTLPGGESTP
jgi:hypothetical protein